MKKCIYCSGECFTDPDDKKMLICDECGKSQYDTTDGEAPFEEDETHDHEREHRDNEIRSIINSYL